MVTSTRIPSVDITAACAAAIAEHRAAAEQARRLPDPLVAELRAVGAFGLLTPAAYGGAELSLQDACDVYEAFGRLDGAVAWCVWNGNLGFSAALLGPAAAATIWDGSRDPIVANSARPSGVAEPVEGGWRLTGRWPIVSAIDIADWVVLFAIAGEEVLAFYLPCADVTVHDTWHTSGMRGTGSNAVSLEGVHVPAAFAVSPFAPSRLDGVTYRIPAFTLASTGCAPVVLGIGQAALDRAAELLAGRPEPAGRLGAAATALAASRALLRDVVADIDAAAAAGAPVDEQLRGRLRAAMSHVAVTVRDVLVTTMELASSAALYDDEPLQRIIRDGLVACQHGALARSLFDARGRHLLGLDAGTPLL